MSLKIKTCLDGMCFIARDNKGGVLGLGQILSSPCPGAYLVQCYSAQTGEKEKFLQVIQVGVMANWMLFRSVEDMMECYSTAKRCEA